VEQTAMEHKSFFPHKCSSSEVLLPLQKPFSPHRISSSHAFLSPQKPLLEQKPFFIRAARSHGVRARGHDGALTALSSPKVCVTIPSFVCVA